MKLININTICIEKQLYKDKINVMRKLKCLNITTELVKGDQNSTCDKINLYNNDDNVSKNCVTNFIGSNYRENDKNNNDDDNSQITYSSNTTNKTNNNSYNNNNNNNRNNRNKNGNNSNNEIFLPRNSGTIVVGTNCGEIIVIPIGKTV